MTANKKWICVFLFILFLITAWVMQHSSPILHIKLVSPVQSTTKIFYRKTHEGYVPNLSVQAPLTAGEQTLSFEPGKMHRSVRWDLTNKPGNFLVKDIWIEVYRFSFKINLDALSAYNQIASLTKSSQGLLIKTTADANTAQVILSIPFQKIYWLKYLSTILTIVLAGAFLVYSTLGVYLYRVVERNFLFVANILRERDFFSLKRFAVLTGIACIFYWYFLSHFYLLIDNEYAAFRAMSPDGGAVWIGQGRWMSYLLDKYVLIQPVVPYVQNFLFCLSIALSYMFILCAYRIKDRTVTYLTYPLFCAFPVWIFILAFYANIASVSVGILFVSAGIFIFDCYKDSLLQMSGKKLNLMPFCVQAVLLAMAIATYQAFILTYIVMGLGLILFNLALASKEEAASGKAMSRIFYLAIITFSGLLLYFLINKLALWLIPADTSYLQGMLDWQRLFQTPIKVVRKVFFEALAYYSGSAKKYGITLNFTGVLIILSSFIYFIPLWKKTSKKRFVLCMGLWGVFLLIPFLLNFISIGSMIATRSLLAIPFVIWFMAIIALMSTKAIAKVGVLAVLFILEFQMLQATGMYAAAIEVTGNHDRALAANLYERVGVLSADGCNETPCVVDVYGLYHITTPYPTAWGSTMGVSFFEWDSGNVNRMLAFMRLLGYTNLVALSEPQRRIENIALFEKMPVWPAAGSVVKSKDIYLIKLSDAPDPAHVKP